MNSRTCHVLTINGEKSFKIAVDPGDEDAISQSIRDGTWTCPPLFELGFALTRPGDAVLDLGAHIGTFALSAAALGRRIVAVDASPRNARLLEESAAQNGFEQLRIVSAAVSDRAGTIEFIEAGPYGMIANPRIELPRIQVPAIAVDELLADMGWDRVDLIKMDVEGSEVGALRGMSRLLGGAKAPPILYESNGHTLALFGQTPSQLLATVAEFGYESYLVEPRRLIPVDPGHLQIDCNVDYLAVKPPLQVPPGWHVLPPRSFEETIAQVIAACGHPHEHHRTYTARTLAQADNKILQHEDVRQALYALQDDAHPDVRAAASWWAEKMKKEGDPSASFQIEGNAIDTEAIMREIRARVRARRAEAKARGLDWEAYADGLYPLPPEAVLSRDLHEAVRYTGLDYDKIPVEMAMIETHWPLVGGLVQRLRSALHELVLFYVNRLAARQVRFNEQAARALAYLVRDLESEIRDLRDRLAEVERQGTNPDAPAGRGQGQV